jgi:AraC-like DNA-binding protein
MSSSLAPPPRRSQHQLTDPAQVCHHLESAYGTRLRLRLNRDPRHPYRLSHARTDAGVFVVDGVSMPGTVEASPDPLHKVVVSWLTEGHLSVRAGHQIGQAGAGDVLLSANADQSHHARSDDVRLLSVVLDPELLAREAANVPSGDPVAPVRFHSLEPLDADAAALWRRTVSYLTDVVLTDDSVATPLVVGHASRLLAAVTLSTFPWTQDGGASGQDGGDQPALLRRAVDFIESNAARDIALSDIAGAIHVTPRAVQYMFRRHLDTTPLGYLRRLRLHHARQDLIAGERPRDTVTAIAARWGFAHTGRFAVMYREAYGESPHTTLRS